MTNTDDIVLCNASGGGFTITLNQSSVSTKKRYTFKKLDSTTNMVIIDGFSTETIDGSLTQLLIAQYSEFTLIPDGVSSYYIVSA